MQRADLTVVWRLALSAMVGAVTLAGCGRAPDADCAAVGRAVGELELVEKHGRLVEFMTEREREATYARWREKCESDRLDDSARRCMANATTMDDAMACTSSRGGDEVEETPAAERGAPAAGAPLEPGVYRIVSLRVDLEPTTKRGIAWDLKPSPDPDPKAVLSIEGRNIAMCRASETLALRCSIGADVEIDADTVFQLQVWDEDALSDDEVGTAELGDASRWALGPELAFATTGRIRRATVRLGRTPTWWQAHRWQVLALAGGLLAAVGGLVGYRRGVIRLTPAPPPPRRCAHCEALLGAKARVCDHCGARVRA